MSKLPRVSGRDCLKALEKVGFYLKRRESSTLRSIIRHAGMNTDDLAKAMPGIDRAAKKIRRARVRAVASLAKLVVRLVASG